MRRLSSVLLAIAGSAASPALAVTLVGSVPGAPDPGSAADFAIDFESAAPPAGIIFTPGSDYVVLQGLVPHQGYNPAGDDTHYLAVPLTGISGSATLDFAGYTGRRITAFSFYWGSIDRDNLLTATSTLGSLDLRGSDLISAGFGSATSARGNRRVSFSLAPGEQLLSLTFASPVAFELDDINFRTASVPEPATWATMMLGFGLAGGRLRRARMQRTYCA